MKKIYLKIISSCLTIAIVMFAGFCQAQNYTLGYTPGTPLDLGSGFAINNPLEGHPPFLAPYSTTVQNTSGQTNFYCAIVRDETSLRQAQQVDAYLSVSGIGYSADAAFGMSSSSFFSSSSITLALTAKTDFGSVKITNPTLDSTAQNYLNANGSAAFLDRYGDNFIIQKEKGVSATLFLTISNLSSSQQSSLSASMSGQYLGFSASASFKSYIDAASSQGNLTVQIAANGADFSTLNNLVIQAEANVNAFDSIKAAFSRYMTQFTYAQAQTIGFTYAPMKNYFNVTGGDVLPSAKVTKLEAIYDNYYNIKAQQNRLDNVLHSQYYIDFHNNSDALEATRLANQFISAKDSLFTAFQTCKADPCSNLNICCNNPVFAFNDALFKKFEILPFSNCIDVNLNYTESYANHTFTIQPSNINGYEFYIYPVNDFYSCTSIIPTLGSSEVKTTFSGNISGGNGFYPADGIGFFENINGVSYNYNWVIPYIPGVYSIYHTYTNTIGADHSISLAIKYSASYGPKANGICYMYIPKVEMTILNPTSPIDAIITPGDAIICSGSNIILTANTCACKYLWSTGETTKSITVNATNNYTVSVTDTVSFSNSNSYWSTVTAKQPPVTPTISGSNILCQGGSADITANSAGCIGCTYIWSTGISGPNLSVNTVGPYVVTASNGCGSTMTSSPKTLTLTQPPAVPTITFDGSLLSTPRINGVTYQWYLNDIKIQDDTTRFSPLSGSGYYSVVITNANGCSSSSSDYRITGIKKELSLSQQVNIYPNPANSKIFIHSALTQNKPILVSVKNMQGQEVIYSRTLQLKGEETAIDISMLPVGIYFLQMTTEEGSISKKFMKE